MQNNAADAGKIGEEIACKYLKHKKYKIVSRNFRARRGEIDIIAKDKKQLVFVEVKYGSSEAYLRVNRKKFRNITMAAQVFLRSFGSMGSKSYRVDVISVSKNGEINHFKDVAIDFGR